MFNAGVKDADIAEICRDGGAPANEPIRESMETTSQYHTWKAFTQYMLNDADTARKLGGYAYDYLNPPFPGCVIPNVDRIQYPLLFAAGCHPWFSFPGRDLKVDHGGSHFPVQRDLFRLATRYSAVLWGHGIDRIRDATTTVEVTSPKGTVWWQDFVYARKLADGRMQWVVHLINEPPSQNIERNSQELPQPQADIPVKFKIPVAKVWALRAEPDLEVKPLTVTNGAVTVPQLGIWTVLVAEEAKR